MKTEVGEAKLSRRGILASSALLLVAHAVLGRSVLALSGAQGTGDTDDDWGGRDIKVDGASMTLETKYGGTETYVVTADIEFDEATGYHGTATVAHPTGKSASILADGQQLTITFDSATIEVYADGGSGTEFDYDWRVDGGALRPGYELRELLHDNPVGRQSTSSLPRLVQAIASVLPIQHYM